MKGCLKFISRINFVKQQQRSIICLRFEKGFIYLKAGMKIFGVLESRIEDGAQPLIKIFALLHKMIVVLHKILKKKR